jgi:hypothetical protein
VVEFDISSIAEELPVIFVDVFPDFQEKILNRNCPTLDGDGVIVVKMAEGVNVIFYFLFFVCLYCAIINYLRVSLF